MKSFLILLLLVIILSLSAQFSDPLEINGLYQRKYSSGQRAHKHVDGISYITYLEHSFVYLTKINNMNFQTHTIIDTLVYDYIRFTVPAIQVLENGNIIIVYSEIEDSENGYLKIATSTNSGESFSVESIEINQFGDPHIAESANGIDICYSNKLQGKSLAEFQHFTEYEKSENADGGFESGIMVFRGIMDEYFGPVHSNDDIWIQNIGGWPIFHDMVTTAGRIMDFTTGAPANLSAPMDDIFLGGYEEEIIPYTHNGTTDIRQNGLMLGADDTDIVCVELANGSFESWYGDIVQTGVDTFGVYSWFPRNTGEANNVVNAGGNWYEDTDQIWTNYVTIYDTIWSNGASFPVTDQSIWAGDAELWIKGEVYGAQTWASANNVYIVGDITYANTQPGDAPDDPDEPNLTDYFGLVSEKKILIRYKHKDPFNEFQIYDENCTNVMLYGAYAALGVGDTLTYGNMACHYDGIFTFQYQHPHGSTPDFAAISPYNTMNDTLYTYVDFHKYIFPPDNMIPPGFEGFNLHGGNPIVNSTCGYPYESPGYITSYPNNGPGYVYPYGTDYPWYNPVWPESSDDIVFERGQLTMFGSLAQTRRGYIHRSGADPYNHPGDNEWDLDEYHYDGTHGSTGYDKDYYFDSRLSTVQLPDFPKVFQAANVPYSINVLHSSNNGQNFSESFLEELDEPLQALWMDSDRESVLIAYQTTADPSSFHFLVSDDNPQVYEHYVVGSDGSRLKNANILGDDIYVLCGLGTFDGILYYQIGNPLTEWIQFFDPVLHLSDFTVGETGALAYVHETWYSDDMLHLDYHYDDENGILTGLENWSYSFENINYYNSEVSLQLDENNTAYSTIILHSFDNLQYSRPLYLISGELEGIVEVVDEEIINQKISMQIFPNPFNPETTISFSLTTENTEKAELSIYNVKGQKVRKIPVILSGDEGSAGQYVVTWNGKDMNSKSVSTGVYLFELKANGKVQKIKKGLLLK